MANTNPTPSATTKHVVIVGTGLSGGLMGILLAKRGYNVEMIEYRSDTRKLGKSPNQPNGNPRARSINLALSTRGLTALGLANLDAKLKQIGIPMYARCLHSKTGEITYVNYGQKGQHLLSVSRTLLNEMLLDALEEQKNVTVRFSTKCEHVHLDYEKKSILANGKGRNRNPNVNPNVNANANGNTAEPCMRVMNMETKRISSIQTTDLIIGADGAFSRVRKAMQAKELFDYSQDYLPAGYKELTIPPAEEAEEGPHGKYRMNPNCLHIWPRHRFMLIALPNMDGSFTCTLFMNHHGENSFEHLQEPESVSVFFEENFPDAKAMMPNLIDEFFGNPTPSLVTVRCMPFHYKDRAVLIGDAAHAIVPFFGQGINCGFEDCRIFMELLSQAEAENQSMDGDVFGTVLKQFSEIRKRDTDTIADLAVANYTEMASRTVSTTFLLKRKMGLAINRLMPSLFMPLYSMISFSNIPYSEAVRKANKQEKMLNAVLGGMTVLAVVGISVGSWMRWTKTK